MELGDLAVSLSLLELLVEMRVVRKLFVEQYLKGARAILALVRCSERHVELLARLSGG